MKSDAFGSRPRRVGLRLRVTLPAALAEEAAALLAGGDAGEVVIHEAPPDPRGGARRRAEREIDPGPAGDATVARLAARLEALERAHPGVELDLEREERLVEEDWGALHPEGFAPFLAAPGLVLRPPWREHAPLPGERVLVVDPGASFGSGSHASTRLALGLLGRRCGVSPPRRMLDVGTGSGVLAMAGALWGAEEVVGVDTDPGAVAAARANVARNGMEDRVRVHGGGVEGLPGEFDLIAANVTAEVLASLAGALAARLAPGGAVVLSGILAGGQDREVEAAYAELGLCRVARREEGEWVALLLGHGPPPPEEPEEGPAPRGRS